MPISISSKRRALFALCLSWLMLVGTVHYLKRDIKATYAQITGDEKMRLEVALDVAEENYQELIHDFDRATRSSSVGSFLSSLHKFHVVKSKLYTLSVANRSDMSDETRLRARNLAKNTVSHFINPFNEQIKKMDATADNGSQLSIIQQFVADYSEFQLIHEGPLSLGRVAPLTTHIIGL